MVAVLMGVGLVVGNGGLVNSTSHSLIDNVASGRPPDLYVTATSDGNVGNGFLGTTTLLPDAWAGDLARIAGVKKVAGTQFSYATLGRRRVVLEGITDGAIDPSLQGVPAASLASVLDGDGVVVSTTLAAALGLSVGSTFVLPTGAGDIPLEVVAVNESFKSNQGAAVVSLGLLQQTSGRPGVSSYDITLAPGADRAAVAGAVRRVVAGVPYPVTVQRGDDHYADIKAAVAQSTAAFVALQWIIVVAASLAVLNTLVISVVERRRELGILRAVGTSRRTVVRMVLTEAAAVGIGGTVLGVLSGFVLSVVGIRGLARSTATPLHFAFSVQPVAFAIVAGAVVCLLGGILPARRAGRIDIVTAIGYE
jgi:putative ABC transport system permease protein